MKRIISLILTFAMCISLLPAVSATETTPAQREYEYVTTSNALNKDQLKGLSSSQASAQGVNLGTDFYYRNDRGGYVLNKNMASWGTVVPADYYGEGDPAADFYAMDTTDSDGDKKLTDAWAFVGSRYSNFRLTGEVGLENFFKLSEYGKTETSSYLAIKVKIDAPGEYLLCVDALKTSDSTGAAPAVYFIADETSFTNPTSLSSLTPIGYFDSDESDGYTYVGKVTATSGDTEYLVVFSCDETSKTYNSTANSSDQQNFSLEGIKLYPSSAQKTVVSLSVDKPEIEVGDTANLSVNQILEITKEPLDTDILDFDITVSDPDAVTVNAATGEITALRATETPVTITATYTDGSSDSVQIKVVKDEVLINLSVDKNEFDAGQTAQLSINPIWKLKNTPVNADFADFTFTVSDPAALTVNNETGVITGVQGRDFPVTITATYTDGSSDSVSVRVIGADEGNEGKTFKYVFRAKDVVTDFENVKQNATRILDFTKFDSYDEINETVTNLWAYNNSNVGYKAFYTDFLWFSYRSADKTAAAIKIKVPNKGKYYLWAQAYEELAGTKADVYISPVGNTTQADLTSFKSTATKIGTIDAGASNSKAYSPNNRIGEVEILERGDYYIYFDLDTSIEGKIDLKLQNLSLVAQPGAPKNVKLDIGGYEGETKTENGEEIQVITLPVGTAKEISFSIYDRVWTELEIDPADVEVEYDLRTTSATGDVVTLSGNVIDVLANGTAELTVTVTYNGTELTKKCQIVCAPTSVNIGGAANYNSYFDGEGTFNWSGFPAAGSYLQGGVVAAPTTENPDNRALKLTFDPTKKTGTANAVAVIEIDRGYGFKAKANNIYQLSFKMKSDFLPPEGVGDVGIQLELMAYRGIDKSGGYAYESRIYWTITDTAQWTATRCADWTEFTVPIIAYPEVDFEDMYLFPRIVVRSRNADPEASGYSGSFWFDDIEVREVGCTDLDITVTGATNGGVINASLGFEIRPISSSGIPIAFLDKTIKNGISFTTTDENIFSKFGTADTKGSTPLTHYIQSSATLLGKNGTATLGAEMFIAGRTCYGAEEVTITNMPYKLLYATLTAADSELYAGETTTVTPQGYLSDGAEADMSEVSIEYKSNTPDIVSIDENGTVTALMAGDGEVVAVLTLGADSATGRVNNSVEKTVSIRVNDSSPVAAVSLVGPEKVGYLRDEKLTIIGTNEDGRAINPAEAEVVWHVEIEDDNYAEGLTVAADGTVYGAKEGTEAVVWAEVSLNGATKTTNEISITVGKTDMRDFYIRFLEPFPKTPAEVKIEDYGWEIDYAKSHSYVGGTTFTNYGLYMQTYKVYQNGVIKVDVPYDGYYQFVFSITHRSQNCRYADVYVDGVYNETKKVIEDGVYTGTIYCNNMDLGLSSREQIRTIWLDKGEHSINFVPREAGGSTWCYITFVDMTLKNVPTLPAITETSAEKLSVAVGNKALPDVKIKTADDFVYSTRTFKESPYDDTTQNVATDPYIDEYMDISYEIVSGAGNIALDAEKGTVTGLAVGEAQIKATINYNGETKEQLIDVSVTETEMDLASEVVDVAIVSEWNADANAYLAANLVLSPNAAPAKYYVVGINTFGEKIVLENADVVWNYSPEAEEGDTEAVVSFASDGATATATPIGNGTVGDDIISVAVTLENGTVLSTEPIFITVRDGKTYRTLYSDEMIKAGLENPSKYSWAKSERDSTLSKADKFVALGADYLWDQISGNGLPRTTSIGTRGYSPAAFCPFCGDITKEYGSYGYNVDVLRNPWKINCMKCDSSFPSNDFASFYELGRVSVAESEELYERYGATIPANGGSFDRMTALEIHRLMLIEQGKINPNNPASPGEDGSATWKQYYGYGVEGGYLYNELYPDVDTSKLYKYDPALESVETWMVDDSIGYDTGKTFENKNGVFNVRYHFVSYYNHNATYFRCTSTGAIAREGLIYLSQAYILSGGENGGAKAKKYGMAAAVIIDRISDIYPTMNLEAWPTHGNCDGGIATGSGGMVGRIWEPGLLGIIAEAYDAIFPIYNDSDVVEFLNNKAEEWGLENNKATSSDIRQNIDDGLFRVGFDAIKQSRARGNFGHHQGGAVKLAVAFDTFPETQEMIDWLYHPESPSSIGYNTGGGINQILIGTVRRDGMNYESVQYHDYGISNLIDIGIDLTRYEQIKQDKNGGESGKVTNQVSLFNHPKYLNMATSHQEQYLLRRGVKTIHDAGKAANYVALPSSDSLKNIFYYIKKSEDPGIKEKAIMIAQHLYQKEGENLAKLRYDIFTPNPEGLADEVKAIIEQYGVYDYDKTNIMTGYGLAILRAGTLHDSVSPTALRDTQRDFTLNFTGSWSHMHYDYLDLGIEAYGMGMTTDLGYPEQATNNPRRMQWISATIAHNTVVVNEANQNKSDDTQIPLHFDAKQGRVQVADATAPDAYSSCEDYRRTIVMIDYDDEVSYGVDFFRVNGGSDQNYTFMPNSETDPEISPNLQGKFEKQAIGSYAGSSVPYGDDPNSTVNVDLPKYPRGYTWLYDVYRAENSGEKEFYLDYAIKDFRGISRNANIDVRLRITAVNDFAAEEIALVNGTAQQEPTEIALIDHLEKFMIRRKGTNLNTLFTTVYEPYREGKKYVESIASTSTEFEGGNVLTITREDNGAVVPEEVKAVRVKINDASKDNYQRIDYIVYAEDNSIAYTVTDNELGNTFDFKGFVGVWTVNTDGEPIYSYLNDGEYIKGGLEGQEITTNSGRIPAVTGTVLGFQEDAENINNWIDVSLDQELTEEEVAGLADRMMNIDLEKYLTQRVQPGNAAFVIKGVEECPETYEGYENVVRFDLGSTSLASDFVDAWDESLGYVYDATPEISTFEIAMSYEDSGAPIFKELGDLSATAKRLFEMKITAEPGAENSGTITYRAKELPRGASFNPDTQMLTWKPESSQIGDNMAAIEATDSVGRTSTIYITIKVLGSTITEEGGGGGGGGAPSDEEEPDEKEPDEENPNENSGNTSGDQTGFVDLGSHAWAEDAINELAAKGIIKGTSESTYSPANNITRADYALLLVRAFKLESENEENFADVFPSDYYAKELAIARNAGIVNGIGDNKYAPRNTITRQDMMVIIYNVFNKLGIELETGDIDYPDYDEVADYAKEAVKALVTSSLVTGKNGYIDGAAKTTRAEVAVLIKRILDYIEAK